MFDSGSPSGIRNASARPWPLHSARTLSWAMSMHRCGKPLPLARRSSCRLRAGVHAAAVVAVLRVSRPARRRSRICDSSALSTALRPAPKTMPDLSEQRPSAHSPGGARPVAWRAARVKRAVRPEPGRHPLQCERHGRAGGVGGSERISWCTQSVHQWKRAASRVFVREGCPRRCRGGATYGNGGGASGHAGNRGVLRSAGDGWGRRGAVDGDGQGGWRTRDPSRWGHAGPMPTTCTGT